MALSGAVRVLRARLCLPVVARTDARQQHRDDAAAAATTRTFARPCVAAMSTMPAASSVARTADGRLGRATDAVRHRVAAAACPLPHALRQLRAGRLQTRTMFIQTQETPNPNSMKFLPGVEVRCRRGQPLTAAALLMPRRRFRPARRSCRAARATFPTRPRPACRRWRASCSPSRACCVSCSARSSSPSRRRTKVGARRGARRGAVSHDGARQPSGRSSSRRCMRPSWTSSVVACRSWCDAAAAARAS